MRITLFLVAVVVASTVVYAEAIENDPAVIFCNELCTQASDLFWNTYASAVSNKKTVQGDATLPLLAKHNAVPEKLALTMMGLSNEMYEKFGSKAMDRKNYITAKIQSACEQSCLEDDPTPAVSERNSEPGAPVQ